MNVTRCVVIIAFLLHASPRLEAKPVVSQFSPALYPDLRVVIPTHLRIINQTKRTLLQFTTGIANTGDGPLRVRAEHEKGLTFGIQEILNEDGDVVEMRHASTYEYHKEHDHWHLEDLALFEVRDGTPDGPVVGEGAVKVSFCLIDTYRLGDGIPSHEAKFFKCEAAAQGISVGWVDQYYRALEGQELDLTGIPPGRYYLINTANPSGKFLEMDFDNNTAWVGFDLTHDRRGNARIKLADNSDCETPGMCGKKAPMK
jgi:hypothetical protein